MKLNKFVQIKDFFNDLFFKKDYEMNSFIHLCSINAIVDYLEDGYILNKTQEQKLKEMLVANNIYESQIEKLITQHLPEKYMYYVLLENFNKVFDKTFHTLATMPNTTQWLIKKNDISIAASLIETWIDSFDNLLKSTQGKEPFEKKIKQFTIFEDYICYGPEEEKQKLIQFIRTKALKNAKNILHRNYYDIERALENILSKLEHSQSEPKFDNNSFKQIVVKLTEQNETEVVLALEDITKKYEVLFSEFNNMDKLKRNAITDLYNKHLLSNLTQYLDIKLETRTTTIKNQTAQQMLLENLEDVKTIFNVQTQLLQEDKLMTLSSKSEYLSQLKKQW